MLMFWSLALCYVSYTMGGLSEGTTVLQSRTRCMTRMQMPCSVWVSFVASIMGLLAFPALFVAAIMMLLDRIVGTSFFMPAVISMGQQLEHGGDRKSVVEGKRV